MLICWFCFLHFFSSSLGNKLFLCLFFLRTWHKMKIIAGPKCYWILEDDRCFRWKWESYSSWYGCIDNMDVLLRISLSTLDISFLSILHFLIFFILIQSGKFLSVLPVDPKLGKMLILGAIFSCFDPILTIVAGLSIRDPFLLPQDKKDVSFTCTAFLIMAKCIILCYLMSLSFLLLDNCIIFWFQCYLAKETKY